MPDARSLPLLFLLLSLVAPADAGSKLDPHVRIALAQLHSSAGGKNASLTAQGNLDVFIVGTATRAELEAAGAMVRTEAGDVRTATIPANAIERVEALKGVVRIEGAVRLEPLLDKSVPATGLIRGPAPEFHGLNGEGVLVGAIDEGFDYDHDDFKDDQGHTRFVSIWDQTDVTGTPPAGYFYGSEWNAAQIEDGVANERDVTGHGTAVLGVLAGDGSATGGDIAAFTYPGMAPKAPIIAIKTNLSSTGVIDAAAYFFARAQQLGMPASLNISLGGHYGPHDGTSPMESALTALSGPGRVVTVAAGNDRGQGKHAVVRSVLPPPQNNAALFVAQPRLGDVVVLAGYYSAAEPMTVELRHTCFDCDPNAPVSSGVVAPGQATSPYPGIATAVGRMYVENGITNYPGGMREIYVEFQSTDAGIAFAGNWVLRFVAQGAGPTNGRVDLWRVYATPPLANFAGGRSDDMLVTEPANANGVISVGAWATKVDWTDCAGVPNQYYPVLGQVGELASFSSPGPTRDGRLKPDLLAPGCEIASATSFDMPVVCSPASAFHLPDGMQHTIGQGTSMSAPHVAGAAALVFQALGPVDGGVVKNWLTGHALADANTGAVPNLDWGTGKLDLSALHTTGVRTGVSGLALAPIRPNPLAADRIRVDFTLPREGDVTVTLVDVRGRAVATLARGTRAAGAHTVTAPLERVAPGLYFVTLVTDAGRVTRRVLLLGRGG